LGSPVRLFLPLASRVGRAERGQDLHKLWGEQSGRETILLPLIVSILMWAVLAIHLYRMYRRQRKYGRLLPAGEELLAYRARMKKPTPLWLNVVFAAFIFSFALWLTLMALGAKDRSAVDWVGVVLIWGGTLFFSLCVFVRAYPGSEAGILSFFVGLFGRIKYVRISSPDLERRIRSRYRTELDQLAALDFSLLFWEGETFSMLSLLLIFPAIVLISMWRKGEVLTIHRGSRILIGEPILASADRSTYANLGGLGTKFRTRFRSGRILETRDNGEASEAFTRAKFVRRICPGASIAETWKQHQLGVGAMEADGCIVDRELNFEAWEEIAREGNAESLRGWTKNDRLEVGA
jgi:hypothetical protein